MIEGTVNDRYDAVVSLQIQGNDGRSLEIEAVVDTGYQGLLILPMAVVTELDLPFAGSGRGFLADSSPVRFPIHRATVHWDGEPRNIPADITGNTPLIGMRLLDGFRLIIDVEVGGDVIIQAKP